LAPVEMEYEGRQMLDGFCTKCGSSLTFVKSFKNKCKKSKSG
jgi:hypothetical protein